MVLGTAKAFITTDTVSKAEENEVQYPIELFNSIPELLCFLIIERL